MDFDEVFATEMDFHAEIQNPWYWRTICRIFNKKECHEVVLKELAFLRMAYDLYQISQPDTGVGDIEERI